MSEHQSQEYRGNGNHEWETVVEGRELIHLNDTCISTNVNRLRVPGGWLYRVERIMNDHKERSCVSETVFVPMPEVVKHKV